MTNDFFNDTCQPDYLDTGLGPVDSEHLSYAFSANERRRGRYMDALYDLVEDCLKVDPARRPSFGDLKRFVESHAAGNEYFRKADGGEQTVDLGLLVSPEREKYKLGFSLWEDDAEGYAAFPDEQQARDADVVMAGMAELDLFL